MEKTFSPIIISSRKAKRHLEHIRAHHKEILDNLEAHKVKVQAWKDKKATERMQQEQVAREQERIRAEQQAKQREAEMAHQKEMSAHAQKMKELELKKLALQEHGD